MLARMKNQNFGLINMVKTIHITLIYLYILLLSSCIEPYEVESISYDNLLVVEGRLTDEIKQHEILLSRTFTIDTTGVNPEKGAIIYIVDQNENSYFFSETEDGTYISDDKFAAQINTEYILKIETSDGKKLSSTPQNYTATATIDDVNINLETNNINDEVINIKVNSTPVENNANYYYYE